jgi:predicted dehydrogenase
MCVRVFTKLHREGMMSATRLAVIGTGLKALDYVRGWLAMPDVEIVAAADVSEPARQHFADACTAAGRRAPRLYDHVDALLAAGDIDAVYISTPHAFHAEQAIAVTRAGLDLLLEKPMVTTAADASRLIAARKASGAHLVVAFQGALSPLVRDTQARAAAGDFGELVSVSANIWEDWAERYSGQWKQRPEISGGGFMFDTGAHMMNTVCQLAGSDFLRVSAYMNNRGRAVDILCAVAGRLASGAVVTFNAAGEGPSQCASMISLFFTKAIVRIDAWGAWREISVSRDAAHRETAETIDNPLRVFLDVRQGLVPNPSPPEYGLRFARLWDAIKASAARDGDAVTIEAGPHG